MADGSLKFDTKIDTDGFEKGTNTLRGQMERLVSTLKRTGNSIVGAFSNTGSIDKTNVKISSLVDEIDRYRDHLYYLEKQGMYFGDKEYDEAYGKLTKLENELNKYKKELAGTNNTQKKASSSARKMSKSMDTCKKSTSGLSHTLKMLKMSILMAFTFSAIMGIAKAVNEGIQNLAQYSKAFNQNASIMMSSLTQLKNALATAFAPIMQVIVPYLEAMISKVIQAINVFAQFTSRIFGNATSFVRAKKVQQDYAASIKNTGKEAKKASSLLNFDELNVLNSNQSSGGADALSPADMFETVPIDDSVINFVDNFKKALEPTIEALGRLKVALEPFKDFVAQGALDFYNNFLVPVGTWALGEGLPRLIDAIANGLEIINWKPINDGLADLFTVLAMITINIGDGLIWIFENILVPLAAWTISNILPLFLDGLVAVLQILNTVIEALKPLALWLFENFLKPLAVWTGGLIIDSLNLLTEGLKGLSDWIINNQGIIANAAILIASFFAAFKIASFLVTVTPMLAMLGSFITSGGLLSIVLAGISTAFAALTSPVTIITAILGLLIYSFIDLYSSSETFRTAVAELGRTWLEALQPVADFVGTVLTDAWNQILKPVIDFFINTLLPNLIDTFKNLWENVLVPLGTFIGTVLQPVFQILSDVLTSLWSYVILPLAKAIGEVFKAAWDGLYQILNKTVIPIIKTVISVLQFLWSNVINPIINVLWKNFKPAFDTVFQGIGGVIDGLKTTLVGIITFITGVFTGDWSKAWEGIKSIFKGIFDSLVAVAKTPINLIIDIINGMIGGVVDGVNAVIRAINSINFDVSDWVPSIGGNSIGFSLNEFTAPKIPKLATGAVIPPNSEFLAILGDQNKGTNIEAPLDTILEAFRIANKENNSGKQEIVLKFDGTLSELARLLKPALEKEDNRVGVRLVTGGAY